jgi:hypothetical protein
MHRLWINFFFVILAMARLKRWKWQNHHKGAG